MNVGVIRNSNLCVVGETKILTRDGYEEIQKIAGQKKQIWNGLEWSGVDILKTGENQKIIKVCLDNLTDIECTEYHKFYIQKGYTHSNFKGDILKSQFVEIVEAKDLKPGMKLVKTQYPVIDNVEHPDNELFKHAYTAGFHTGDGTYRRNNIENTNCTDRSLENFAYCKRHIEFHQDGETSAICKAICNVKQPSVSLYGEKIELLKYLETRSVGKVHDQQFSEVKKLNVQLTRDLPEKYQIPINCSIDVKLRWLEGLMDADGCLTKNDKSIGLQICSIHKEFLINLRLLLNTLGVQGRVSVQGDRDTLRLMPDGRGGEKEYLCKKSWRLTIGTYDLNQLIQLGYSPKRLKIPENTENTYVNASHYIKVKEIKDEGRIDDTYCFNEPLRHAGIFNGVLLSNCNEITLYSDDKEYAVCTLASVGLPMFVNEETREFDHEKLVEVMAVIVKNLNRVVDYNYYPTPETRRSNLKNRPLGIGEQGLSDCFMKMRIPYDSEEARVVNRQISETMYYGALKASMEMARDEKVVYERFEGSPMSKGILQFDMWGVEPSDKYDWKGLKEEIMKYGLANSTLIALMPTASTSQILGNNECFEPITSNIYTRSTIAGDFVVINKFLVKDLMERGMWNKEMKDAIITENGSIQGIDEIPMDLKNLYKTVWEIKQKVLIDLSVDRGPYVCQTQSLNLFFEEPDSKKLTSALSYGWKHGLKTGSYYIRSRPKVQAQQFTIDPSKKKEIAKATDYQVCEVCSA
jgi:ribonucleoside-diphosphate reductase alpha chain